MKWVKAKTGVIYAINKQVSPLLPSYLPVILR
jgi:hypothetical protein